MNFGDNFDLREFIVNFGDNFDLRELVLIICGIMIISVLVIKFAQVVFPIIKAWRDDGYVEDEDADAGAENDEDDEENQVLIRNDEDDEDDDLEELLEIIAKSIEQTSISLNQFKDEQKELHAKLPDLVRQIVREELEKTKKD